MKYFFNYLLVIQLFGSCSSNILFDEQAGMLRLAIDNTGKMTTLEDMSTNINYVAKEASYLIECSKYGADSIMVQPFLAENLGDNKYLLSYPNGVKLTVSIVSTKDYFRMELVAAEPLSDISQINWGPYNTNMQSYSGEWFGIIRSDDCTIGILGLEPNTDGYNWLPSIAQYTDEGASLKLTSFDHTKGVFRDGKGKENKLRISTPIDVTVVGSAIAMYSSKAGYDNELDAVEKVVRAEELPYPTINGEWNKRSIEAQKFCLWAYYTEENFDEYIEFANDIGASTICNPSGFSSNWGHFDVDLKKYGSIEAICNNSRKADELGIGTALYSLTTFLKPINAREPYLAPVPDDRLQTWRYETVVNKKINKNDKTIILKNDHNTLATLEAGARFIRINNEFIEFKEYKEDGGSIIISECLRGEFHTDVATHKEQTLVKFMYVAGYRNFYPGTIELSNEFSDRFFNLHKAGEHSFFVTDGFESCLETGYNCYAGNLFMDKFYKHCVENNRETLLKGSNFSQYSWHHYSHMSWGEGDSDKGVRGSMLDYRLSRQVLLSSSLMPKKLGQFYPDQATVEDVEWLMAFSTGWDSGVDFLMNLNSFKKNPDYDEIVAKLHLWTEARIEKAFTEEQKRDLRQTDREYKLSRKSDGSWNLKFVKYWQWDKVKIKPSSDMQAKSISGGDISSCSIDWFWTHNPATYHEVILSDDMTHNSGSRPSEWSVLYPKYTNTDNAWFPTDLRYFQFVLRLPEDAPCAVSNIKVTFNGDEMVIPMTLNPGEYLTMPHLTPTVCIYDKEHQLVEEKKIRGYIPYTEMGSTAKITMAGDSEDKNKNPQMIMNVRCQNGFYYQ